MLLFDDAKSLIAHVFNLLAVPLTNFVWSLFKATACGLKKKWPKNEIRWMPIIGNKNVKPYLTRRASKTPFS